ncbi:MAG: TIGR00282 family metallophosphoesterase [Candidatus Komeilibacteria bacterium]
MPAKSLKIIFFGDVVGKLGRRAVITILPQWKKKYKPDLVIANVENLAHGKGITAKTLTELKTAGVTVFTGGNHVYGKEDPTDPELMANFSLALPANMIKTPDNLRYQKILSNQLELYVVNFLGQFQIESDGSTNPFLEFDKLYDELGRPKLLLLDFHAEATSEKVAFGLYCDGRASAIIGTHTHIPTADARILLGGSGYISDVGMVGGLNTVLGVKADIIINRFKGETTSFDWPENGEAIINAVYLELDSKTGHCLQITPLQANITV